MFIKLFFIMSTQFVIYLEYFFELDQFRSWEINMRILLWVRSKGSIWVYKVWTLIPGVPQLRFDREIWGGKSPSEVGFEPITSQPQTIQPLKLPSQPFELPVRVRLGSQYQIEPYKYILVLINEK